MIGIIFGTLFLARRAIIFKRRNKKAYPFHVLRFYAAAPSNTAIEFFLEWNEVMCGRDPSIEKQKASLSLLYMTAGQTYGCFTLLPTLCYMHHLKCFSLKCAVLSFVCCCIDSTLLVQLRLFLTVAAANRDLMWHQPIECRGKCLSTIHVNLKNRIGTLLCAKTTWQNTWDTLM